MKINYITSRSDVPFFFGLLFWNMYVTIGGWFFFLKRRDSRYSLFLVFRTMGQKRVKQKNQRGTHLEGSLR